ncbi:MAG: hypothetical protein COA80_04885 [Leeuwenhoekiella sp.]|nr:MAG: hypothetical protein COA80_04885 [Leeuwenhoekiella sp.]
MIVNVLGQFLLNLQFSRPILQLSLFNLKRAVSFSIFDGSNQNNSVMVKLLVYVLHLALSVAGFSTGEVTSAQIGYSVVLPVNSEECDTFKKCVDIKTPKFKAVV